MGQNTIDFLFSQSSSAIEDENKCTCRIHEVQDYFASHLRACSRNLNPSNKSVGPFADCRTQIL